MTTGPLLAKYQKRLAAIPPPGGGGCHVSLLGVANLGIMAGIDPEAIFHDLRAAVPRGKRRVSDQEIRAAIQRAMNDHKAAVTLPNGEPYRRYRPSKAEPVIKDGKSTLQAIIEQSKIYDEADLWESSPIRLDWEPQEDAGKFLFAMFELGDLIFIGERHEAGTLGGTIRPVAEWIKHFQTGGKAGPHIIINSLNGLPVEKKTNDGVTYRGDGNVSNFRYAMAEFDALSRENQIRFWTAVKLPIAALVDSGGKSIHALLKVSNLAQVNRLDQWATHIKGRLYDQGLIPLGIDSACSNPARLSRLPGYLRDTGRYQRLLWLAEPQRGDA